MELTAKNVENVIFDCLFKDDEMSDKAVIVNCITRDFGFHPERLDSHKGDISDMLQQLPDGFKDGWSFLNACNRKDGIQWGEHRDIENLLALGMATGRVAFCFKDRSMWSILPGGMPYFRLV